MIYNWVIMMGDSRRNVILRAVGSLFVTHYRLTYRIAEEFQNQRAQRDLQASCSENLWVSICPATVAGPGSHWAVRFSLCFDWMWGVGGVGCGGIQMGHPNIANGFQSCWGWKFLQLLCRSLHWWQDFSYQHLKTSKGNSYCIYVISGVYDT